MFVRVKPSGGHRYLQIAQNYRQDGKVKQKILCTLGRIEVLTESGKVDRLAESLLRFCNRLKVIDLHKQGKLKATKDISIGPALVFERLWKELGIGEVIGNVLSGRRYGFDLERAVFLTVLHRLFDPGSDRAAERWREDFRVPGAEAIELHQLYRAMGWLGEKEADGAQRLTKDRIEELLFAGRRDLFSSLKVLFFDTTSIYFEGEGGESIGQFGHSKDKRSDLKQIVVGAALDDEGRPVCCEILPGNASDVKLFLPVIKGIKSRFGVDSFCVVADRGMISKKTIEALESPGSGIDYILGCRMRRQKEVKEEVLGRGGRYQEVEFERETSEDPLVIKVKEVEVEGRRYIVCFNPEQAIKDAADRQAIAESLRERLKRGEKSLVGNRGYRKYLKNEGGSSRFSIDEEKLKEEARYDGKWVLRTNTSYSAEEVAFQYKQLWMVEQAFRSVKGVLETRPIYHKCDDTIRGHVFCSFLALMLMKELLSRLERKGKKFEWNDIKRDLQALREIELETGGEKYYLRTELRGTCFDVLSAAGVAVPPTLRR
jgi:transposase|tara:strand:+ start:203 stop:1834 length:1632 start_codon:yes stop_codon:yes gene_type:complete